MIWNHWSVLTRDSLLKRRFGCHSGLTPARLQKISGDCTVFKEDWMGTDANSLETQYYLKKYIFLLRVYQDVHNAKNSNKIECVWIKTETVFRFFERNFWFNKKLRIHLLLANERTQEQRYFFSKKWVFSCCSYISWTPHKLHQLYNFISAPLSHRRKKKKI